MLTEIQKGKQEKSSQETETSQRWETNTNPQLSQNIRVWILTCESCIAFLPAPKQSHYLLSAHKINC